MNVRVIIALFGLIITSTGGFLYVRSLSSSESIQPPAIIAPIIPKAEIEYEDVLVAKENILYGTHLNSDNLKWQKWPKKVLSEHFIIQTEHTDAMETFSGHLTRDNIYAGDPIHPLKLVDTENKSVMTALLTPGMRAIALKISDDTAAGGYIHPGDHVDIILAYSERERTSDQRIETNYYAKTIMKNIRILAIDAQYQTPSPESGAHLEGKTAILELTPTDAEILKEIEKKGDLILSLRSFNPTGSLSLESQVQDYTRKNPLGTRGENDEAEHIAIFRQGQAKNITLTEQR